MVKKPFKEISKLFVMEDWKNCIENYEVSNFGNIRRKMNNGEYKIIGGSIQNRGYKYFQLIRDGKRINYLIHQLVAKFFIGDRPNGLVIDHIDRNKLNNNVNNLRYITQQDNSRNHERVNAEIPFDIENRHSLVCKKYREDNKDKLKQQKKEYYEQNKNEILEKEKNNKIEVICDRCKNPRIITKTTFNRNKRLNVNTCRKCQSILNLNITSIPQKSNC